MCTCIYIYIHLLCIGALLREYNVTHFSAVYLGRKYERVKGEKWNRTQKNEKLQLDVNCREILRLWPLTSEINFHDSSFPTGCCHCPAWEGLEMSSCHLWEDTRPLYTLTLFFLLQVNDLRQNVILPATQVMTHTAVLQGFWSKDLDATQNPLYNVSLCPHIRLSLCLSLEEPFVKLLIPT